MVIFAPNVLIPRVVPHHGRVAGGVCLPDFIWDGCDVTPAPSPNRCLFPTQLEWC